MLSLFHALPAILACPVCTYDRVMPTWWLFVVLRATVVLLIARGRMDPIRLLGAFMLFEGFYFFAWRFLVWYSHPAVSEGTVMTTSMIGLIVFSVGLPAAIFLWSISRIKYFRAKAERQMTFRRWLLILPVFFVLTIIQGM
jgi:hypothetical protein